MQRRIHASVAAPTHTAFMMLRMTSRTTLTAADAPAVPDEAVLPPGTAVEVRCRFVERWARGFEVATIVDGPIGPCYRLRRSSDSTLLPEAFAPAEVRPDPRYAPRRWLRPTGAAG